MDNASVKRRLTCILAADAVGYSRLMSEDEATTLRVLAAHRSVIDGVIAFHDGRIVGTAGDSVLAEFSSAVEAVRCAVEIQDALRTRNESLPENQRMLFRVGVNLGDVVVKGGDLLGDGVNIAARLESIAPPGGIVISSSVYDQITGKLDLGFHDIGEQTLKNITHPVRAFAVSGAGGTVRVPIPVRPRRSALPWAIAGLAVAVIVAVIAVGVGWKAGWFGATAPAPATVNTTADPEREKLKAEVAAAEQARAAAEARANEAAAEAARTRAESEAAAMKSKAQSEATAVKAKAEADAAALRSKSQAEAQAAAERTRAANEAAAKTTSDAAAIREKAEADAAAARARTAPAPKVAGASPAPPRADYGGAWTGRVVCEAIDDLSAGTFKVTVTASSELIAIDWPVAGTGGNGHAEGRPSADGSLTLRGSSISRSSRSLGKSIGVRFDGTSIGRGFELRGHIGLRNCTLTLAQTG